MNSAKKVFAAYLASRGLKFTPERKIILENVAVINEHFNADELYEFLRKRKRNISRASVYRTISLLVQSGLISKSLRRNERESYEYTFGHEHHDHLICVSCGRIIEFRNDAMEKLQNGICEKLGFFPIGHQLEIKGYCKKCRAKGKRC